MITDRILRMKIECLREPLLEATVYMGRMVGKNLALHLLGTVLFEADSKTLTLRATNLDIGAEIIIPAIPAKSRFQPIKDAMPRII